MKKQQIALIYPPLINQVANINISAFDKTIGAYPPLGLLYIATAIKHSTPFSVEIVDCFAKKMTFEEIRKTLSALRPDFIGIYAMTHFLVDVVTIATVSKEIFPSVPVIVGGPHTTIYPVSTIKHPSIDYAIKGEGEVCFPQLVSSLNDNRTEEEIALIPGVAGKIHLQKGIDNSGIELQLIDDLGSIPLCDHTLIDHNDYYSLFAEKGTFTTLMTSRGCPFQCIYCNRMGKTFRPVPSAMVIQEIIECTKRGITNFFLHDDTFTINKKRIEEVCQALLDNNLKIKWEARSRVDCVTWDLLKLMKEAGLSRMSFGVESGNEKILLSLKKGITLERVVEVFQWCRKLDITTLADFMIGTPGETEKEIEDSIRFIKKIKPHYVQFSITCPYPATPLYDNLLKEGIISSDLWLAFAENPRKGFIPPLATNYFTREELEKIAVTAYKKVYFSLPFIIKELKKMRSWESFCSRVKSAFSLLKG